MLILRHMGTQFPVFARAGRVLDRCVGSWVSLSETIADVSMDHAHVAVYAGDACEHHCFYGHVLKRSGYTMVAVNSVGESTGQHLSVDCTVWIFKHYTGWLMFEFIPHLFKLYHALSIAH